MKSKKGMKVDLDVRVAENITVAYLQTLLLEEQQDIINFMAKPARSLRPALEWETFYTKVNTVQNLLAMLKGIMEDKDFEEFSKRFYDDI
jgi:hypothetical protein